MKKLITSLAILGLVSCGGGTNNDQGTSFTLLGYTDDCTDNPSPNVAGVTVPLSTDTEPNGFSGGILVGLVTRNNLERQFIRTENAFYTYFIPGASAQPPATSAVAGSIVDAAGTGTATAPASGTLGCVETFIVPPEVRQWLVLNRQFLPELPFSMEVSGYITGISQAGDRFDTNEVKFLVQFTPDVVIPPAGEGEDTGAGTIDEGESTDGGTIVDPGVDSEDGDTGSDDQL